MCANIEETVTSCGSRDKDRNSIWTVAICYLLYALSLSASICIVTDFDSIADLTANWDALIPVSICAIIIGIVPCVKVVHVIRRRISGEDWLRGRLDLRCLCWAIAGFAGMPVLLGLLVPMIDKTSKETVDGIIWRYKVSNGCATIGRSSRQTYSAISVLTSGDLAIPVALGGHPVVGIDSFAFEKCSRLTSITIPDGVESIGYGAMEGCYKLEEVTIPQSVTKIAENAFCGCPIGKVFVVTGDVERVGKLLCGKGIDVDKVEFVEREEAQTASAPSFPAGGQSK